MNREQAIAWLRALGHKASARDWALGETIKILVGQPEQAGEIQVYPGCVYLCPISDGAWKLHDTDMGVPEPAETFADLETATQAAHEYVVRKEATLGPVS